MSTISNKAENKTGGEPDTETGLTLRVVSFGYKQGKPPLANALFDVRFLKNPFWVEHLRPLTGRDLPVQEYLMDQEVARDFLAGLTELFSRLLPQIEHGKISEFRIAFGCTGGQHRSAAMVELLAGELSGRFPELKVEKVHRELDGKLQLSLEGQEDGR
jgi:RNase adapter protein RapZ